MPITLVIPSEYGLRVGNKGFNNIDITTKGKLE